jgi:transketolase
MARIGVKDMFGESGKPEDLLVKYGLMASDIVQAVKAALARKK